MAGNDDTFPAWFETLIRSIEDGSCGGRVSFGERDPRWSTKLTTNMTEKLAEVLRTHHEIVTDLTLTFIDFGAAGGAALAESLGSLNSLQSLQLSNLDFGSNGGAALAESLGKPAIPSAVST
ncbi:hypothetical protein PTSG_01129 [Salpingoeca rosetta]|uniref:Uncharacterized protein n=1 Tax=Salpingoeca rosetta (strain ATCC 50818 / BSB-021) TaxID=946362 RepID=F2U0W4_SALR5|nr:uncharacterized protein PTSG_01129 [Salpingoeca rosetta]EGD80538.1 hypothetical protein PTSG_01129 [Salpingoeca rosetta]|eukprot:XP_004997099.1 hypothetical protein PTSG_01129 [Salpingoeca rosetta]